MFTNLDEGPLVSGKCGGRPLRTHVFCSRSQGVCREHGGLARAICAAVGSQRVRARGAHLYIATVASKLRSEHLSYIFVAIGDSEAYDEGALFPRDKLLRRRQQCERAVSIARVVLQEGLDDVVTVLASRYVGRVLDQLVEEGSAAGRRGVLDDSFADTASILVTTHRSDAALELREDGFEHVPGAVVNDALQHEICVRRPVHILDGAFAKQHAQNRGVMRRSAFGDHGLQSSTAGAVEGRPKNPFGVQIDELAVQYFPCMRRLRRRGAVDFVSLAHRAVCGE